MALASAQALLDELMGRDRNLNPAEKKQDIKWSDPEVCKHYFVKFCPHELFINTKADLGPCNKVHDNRLKKDYESSSHYQKMGYEEEFLRFCQSMLSEVDKRICRARQRLALGNQEGTIPQPPVLRSNEEKIMVLTERINELLSQVEHLGCEGMVEEAQGIMKLCDQLKEEREAMQKASESSHWLQTAEIAAAQEKQMEVCDVCGAFLIVGDAQQRVDDHLMGKQHVGYAMLKNAVEEITNKRQKDREERDKKRDRVRDEKKKQKEEGDRIRETHRKKEDERKREMERRSSEKYRRSSHSWDRGVSRSHSSSHNRNTDRKSSYSSSKNKDEGRHKHRSRSRDRKRSRSPSRNSRYSRRSSSHSPEHKKDHKHRSRDSRDKSKEDRDKGRSKRKERSARSQSFENGDLISEEGTSRKEEEHEYEQETPRAGDSHQ